MNFKKNCKSQLEAEPRCKSWNVQRLEGKFLYLPRVFSV